MRRVGDLAELDALRDIQPAFCVLDTIPVTETPRNNVNIRLQTTIYILKGNNAFRDEYNGVTFHPDKTTNAEKRQQVGELLYGCSETPYIRTIDGDLNIYAAYKTRVVPVVIVGQGDEGYIRNITDPEECVLYERPAFTVLRKTDTMEERGGSRITFEISPNYSLRQMIDAAKIAYAKDLDYKKVGELEEEFKNALGVRGAMLYRMEKTDHGSYQLTFGWRKYGAFA